MHTYWWEYLASCEELGFKCTWVVVRSFGAWYFAVMAIRSRSITKIMKIWCNAFSGRATDRADVGFSEDAMITRSEIWTFVLSNGTATALANSENAVLRVVAGQRSFTFGVGMVVKASFTQCRRSFSTVHIRKETEMKGFPKLYKEGKRLDVSSAKIKNGAPVFPRPRPLCCWLLCRRPLCCCCVIYNITVFFFFKKELRALFVKVSVANSTRSTCLSNTSPHPGSSFYHRLTSPHFD